MLFIGGTGKISAHCVDAAVARGFEVSVLNRGQMAMRPRSPSARYLLANARDPQSVRAAVEGMKFDCVVNFVAYDGADVEHDLALFRGRIGQYIFISSASAYQTPPARTPITGSTRLSIRFGPTRRRRSKPRRCCSAPFGRKVSRQPSSARPTPMTKAPSR